MEIDAVPACKT